MPGNQTKVLITLPLEPEMVNLTGLFRDDLQRYLAGQPLRNGLDPVLLYRSQNPTFSKEHKL